MSKRAPHNFHVRLDSDILAVLMEAKGSKSLNREINERLRKATGVDEGTKIADALRPVLDSLSDADRAELVKLALRAVEILSKGNTPKRQKRR